MRTPICRCADDRYADCRVHPTTCDQCGQRVYRTPSGGGWTDLASDTDILGSGEVCLAGPRLTHQHRQET